MNRLLLSLCLLALAACDDGDSSPAADASPTAAPTPDGAMGGSDPDGATDPDPDPEGCVPDRAEWDTVKPTVEARCGRCHGSVPQFGAPFALQAYDDLVAGTPGERPVDLLVTQLQAGAMPPAGQTQPTTPEKQAMLDWATCGEADEVPANNPGGFDSTAPVLGAPEEPPADSEFFDLRAPAYEVPPDDDHYGCFSFHAPTDGERFIRRIEAVIDDSRVVHHIVLLRAPAGTAAGRVFNCFDITGSLYAWAPGMGPLHFQEGGIRMPAGQPFIVQIHYNNRQQLDATDSTAIRIFHGDTTGPEVAQVTLGPPSFEIPGRGRGEATGHCVMPQDVKIIASWPHMHEIGSGFEGKVVHADGSETDLVTLDGWDFESQFVYDTAIDLKAGDRIVTRCEWENPTAQAVGFGPDTGDEMCFNFVYHTPPLPWSYCDQAAPDDGDAIYEGGACLPDIGEVLVSPFLGQLIVGEPPDLQGGPMPEGVFTIAESTVYIASLDTPAGRLDTSQSGISGRGLVVFEPGRVVVDFDADIQAAIGPRVLDVPFSSSGAAEFVDIDGGHVLTEASCGDFGSTEFFYEQVDGTVRVRLVIELAGLPLDVTVRLRRVD